MMRIDDHKVLELLQQHLEHAALFGRFELVGAILCQAFGRLLAGQALRPCPQRLKGLRNASVVP